MTLIKQWLLPSGPRVVFTREPDIEDKKKEAEFFKLTLAPIHIEVRTTSHNEAQIMDGLAEKLATKLRQLADEIDNGKVKAKSEPIEGLNHL